VSRDEFAERLRSRNGQVKGVLTDQEVLAGVGNAYSDEILHVAKMSPFALTSKLTDGQITTLYEATRQVETDAVTRSVGQRAAELKGEKRAGLRVHARTGLPVPGLRRHRSARCPSRTRACSTARPARPAASRWPTGVCPS
jgi:formamidopyrimidine-DNA glycosylase